MRFTKNYKYSHIKLLITKAELKYIISSIGKKFYDIFLIALSLINFFNSLTRQRLISCIHF